MNGDGLVDLVRGGTVYFNRLTNGQPAFQNDNGAGTAVQVGTSAVAAAALPDELLAELQEQFESDVPPIDAVRVWEAPYSGRIRITGSVRLDQPQRNGADGLRTSIEHEGDELWSHRFGPNETAPQNPQVTLDISAGQQVFFRVHAQRDARDDRVRWSPVVTYMNLAPSTDENGLDAHRFDAARDFALAGRPGTGIAAPLAGTMRLVGELAKLRATSDDIEVSITVDGNSVFSQTLGAATASTMSLDRTLQVSAGSFVALRLHSDSPIDASAITFNEVSTGADEPRQGPWISYLAAYDQDGQELSTIDHLGRPTFEIPLPYAMTAYSQRSRAEPAPSIEPASTETVQVQARVRASAVSNPGQVTFTAKSNGRLLAKDQVTVSRAGTQTMTLNVPVTEGERVFFAFSVSDPDLYNTVVTWATGSISTPTIRYGVSRHGRLPATYRGWTFSGYNAGGELGEQPIPPGVLDGTPIFDGTEEITDEETARLLAEQFMNEEMEAVGFMPLPDPLPCPYKEGDPIECTSVRGAHWGGPDSHAYVTGTHMSASRLSGLDSIVPQVEEIAGAQAVPRLSKSDNEALGGGVLFASFSRADGDSWGVLDFLDMNGDSFPDVVATDNVQYTSPLGQLSETVKVGIGDVRKSSSESETFGIGGNPAKNPFGSAGQTVVEQPSNSINTAKTEQMARIGFVLSLGASGSESEADTDLMDVNGDGLPDRVVQEGATLSVALNLGYRFAPYEPWGQAIISEGNTGGMSGGVSINDGVYGFAGGVNASLSRSRIDDIDMPLGGREGATMLDVNGDGLLDRVEPGNGGLDVWFNLGHRIASQRVTWSGSLTGSDISESDSTTLSGGIYITIPIGIPGIGGLVINPGIDAGETIGRPTSAIRDIDGDGYPDHLASQNPHQVTVARNLTGRTNLLRSIERPLGAKIWLDYHREGNTQDMPQSRWVLDQVKVYDGVSDSAELGQANDYTFQKFHYQNGQHDRYEREFYGFASVVVETMDTRGWNGISPASNLPVYRKTETDYLNQSYHKRGLESESRLLAGDGSIYQRSRYTYQLRDPRTGAELTDAQARAQESVFPALIGEDHYQHEGDPGQSIHTFTRQNYDSQGNVIELYDAGGPGANDDYRAEIRYSKRMTTCLAHHIVGKADRIIVRDAAGTILRRREADIDCASGTGDVRQIRVHQGSGQIAQTDLFYNGDGNLTGVTAPRNHNHDRYHLAYTYDGDVRTHVVRIDDSFGYYSTAAYDMRFGAITSDTDINGNTVTTQYDAFGRISRITGPYELQHGLPYAILFGYATTAAVPYATTAHMDRFRNTADPIETVTFIDGLGRALQTKKDATVHRGADSSAQDVMIVSGRAHLDPWGRTVATWHPTEEPKSSAVNRTFSRAADSIQPTRMIYDLLDRTTRTTLPDNARTLHTYTLQSPLSGGGLWAMTETVDPEDNRRDQYQDARGRIRAVKEYLDGRPITTRYEYDPLDQIRTVTDAHGNLTDVRYDIAGRRTDVVHPDSGHTEMVYDPAGNVVRRITPNLRRRGGAIQYVYHFTQLIGIDYPHYPENNVTYTWGPAFFRGQGGNRVGRITKVEDASGWEERHYGALGEVIRETRSVASHTMGSSDNSPEIYTTEYVYDTWGRLQHMTYPDTEELTYSYDSGGNVRAAQGVKLGITFPYLARLEYDRFEQRVFSQYGNGIRTTYRYDPRRRWLTDLDAGDFQRQRYTFDKVGNVLTLANAVNNVPPNQIGGPVHQSFTYDDLYRLTYAEGEWRDPPVFRNRYTYAMAYDDIHNITRKNQFHAKRTHKNSHDIEQHKTTYDWEYDYGSSKPHAATHIGDRTFFYDDNGNQVGWDVDWNGQRRTIIWDEENRVRSISDNGRTTRFIYDDSGERVFKIGAQGETVYVNQHWTVRNRSIGTKHVFVGTQRIASKLSPGDAHVRPGDHDLVARLVGNWWEHRSQNGHDNGNNLGNNPNNQMPDSGQPDANFVYFYHKDHLGSTSFTTAVDSELYSHVQYFPSGETWVDQRTNTERLPYLFTDKELDQETGLYYFGARYYDPRVGLWASTDPAASLYLQGAPAGGVYLPVNLATYAYVAHNPLILYDPDGRSWWSKTLDWVQGGLDVVSLGLDATGIGASVSWAPDLLNAGISAGRGDWTGAGLSAVAAVPFIGAAANTTRLGRTALKHGDEVVDLGKTAAKKRAKQTGSYTNTHASGKTYEGKGTRARSQESGRRVEKETGDPHVATDWTPASNRREAFKQESQRLDAAGGPKSPSNYNKIESPGKKMRIQDGD